MPPDNEDADGPPTAAERRGSTNEELCKALYASCVAQNAGNTAKEGNLFFQEDLQAMNVVPNGDLEVLTACVNRLQADHLFVNLNREGRACWRIASLEDANKYRDLSVEEALVYAYIDSAGRAGMWTRIIRARTNLHQAVVTRCLKTLETRKRIKPVKSSQYPTRKVYILAHLQPSEDVTGGPFYTDGALDTEFVRVICQWVERYVAGRSWGPAPSAHGEKTARAGSRAQAEAVRKKALAGGSRAAEVGLPRPMPPGYAGFPTTAEITRASNASGLSTVDLKEAEMRQLLDLLRWDGKLVRAWNGSWRSARSASVQARFKREDEEDGDGSNEEGSGLAYAPCGRCPVFGLCREGGPVSARKCPYFQDWLKM